MDNYEYFYNEKGDYTITKNDLVIDHVKTEDLAKFIVQSANRLKTLETLKEKITNFVTALDNIIEELPELRENGTVINSSISQILNF